MPEMSLSLNTWTIAVALLASHLNALLPVIGPRPKTNMTLVLGHINHSLFIPSIFYNDSTDKQYSI